MRQRRREKLSRLGLNGLRIVGEGPFLQRQLNLTEEAFSKIKGLLRKAKTGILEDPVEPTAC
jgi:hypothetical protein